jgi:hypothetical protein
MLREHEKLLSDWWSALNGKNILPGAQTERRGDAKRVQALCGGAPAPAAFLSGVGGLDLSGSWPPPTGQSSRADHVSASAF